MKRNESKDKNNNKNRASSTKPIPARQARPPYKTHCGLAVRLFPQDADHSIYRF